MSNAMAIATVTDTLRRLIHAAIKSDHNLPSDADVTVLPPDRAHNDPSLKHFVNLFLYQVLPNAAWRNIDTQSLMKPGSTSMSPLALNLYYMLTAYSQGDDVHPHNVSTISHQLLGHAMSALHDHAVLLLDDIAQANPKSELQNQIDRVRITLQPLSVEEIFRLWSGFQSQYRISVAYEASVLLIDSTQIPHTALPVRIPNITVRSFRVPIIEKVTPELITAGKQITIEGHNLKGDAVHVKIGDKRIAPDSVSEKRILVTLPNKPTDRLPAGINTIQVEQGVNFGRLDYQTQRPILDAKGEQVSLATDPHPGFESNIHPFVLHPTITSLTFRRLPAPPTVTVTVNPPIGKGQRVVLLLNELQVPTPHVYSFNVPPRETGPDFVASIDIAVTGAANGQYLARMMVDGAESGLDVDTTSNQFTGPKVNIS